MAAVMMQRTEFFCPSDRELALRGQIKTGWSTVAARKSLKLSDVGLTLEEKKKIYEVLDRADAQEKMEKLRIGLQIMRFKQLSKNVRGDGSASCKVCGYDFTAQWSRRQARMHFCQECEMAVCPRCISNYHCQSGKTQILCKICFEERELWKKSGAWLSNSLPVINIPKDELERFQQHQYQQATHKVALGRQEDASTEFSFSKIEAEDSDEGDDSSFHGSHSSINFDGSSSLPPSHEGSPCHRRVFPAAHDDLQRTQSDSGRPRAVSDSLTTRGRLTRKGAMSGSQKIQLQQSRDRLYQRRTLSLERNRKRRERSTSPLLKGRSHSPSPPSSRTSNSPPRRLSVTSGEDLAPPLLIKQQVTTFPNPPVITIRRPSTPVNPHLSRDDHSGIVIPQPQFERDDLSSDVGPQSQHVREFHAIRDDHPADKNKPVVPVVQYGSKATDEQQEKPHESFIDRGRPPISTQPQVPESRKHAPFWSAKPENDVEASDTLPEDLTHSPQTRKHKPIHTPQKQTSEKQKDEEGTSRGDSLEDEFKKVKVGSSKWHKDSVGKPPSKPDKATSPPSKPDKATSPPSKPDKATSPPSKPDKASSPAHSISDEFKKVVMPPSESATAESDEFRKVKPRQSEDETHTRRRSLGDIGKQDSVTSSASETSIGKSKGGTVSSIDSWSSVESAATTELQPSVESQPPAETQFKWKRKGARRLTKARGSGPTVEATDDFVIVDTGSEAFRYRARSGAMSKPHRSESGKPRPGEFRKVKSPLPAKGGENPLLEREQFSRPRSYSGGGSSLERRGGKRRAEKTLSGVTVTSEHGAYGSIVLSLEYAMQDSMLKVTVHNCKGLKGVDSNGLSDPYVKLFLIPGHKKNHFKTSIVRKNLNPEYHESFTLQGITQDMLEKKSLGIIVMDHDDFGSDEPLGAARIPLYEATGLDGTHLRKLLADLRSIRFPLEGTESEEKGRILLTISYSAQDHALTIGVGKALDLPAVDSSGLADPYVKCLLEARTFCLKQRTKTCARNLNPTFNEELVFTIKQQDLPYCKLMVAVWHRKKLGKDVHIGKVVFQSPAFWQKYAMQPNYQLTEWHSLSDHKN